jgi:hypothetical protein
MNYSRFFLRSLCWRKVRTASGSTDCHAQSQQEPTFHSLIAHTRLTTKSALKALQDAGVEALILPSANGMGLILNWQRLHHGRADAAQGQGQFWDVDHPKNQSWLKQFDPQAPLSLVDS